MLVWIYGGGFDSGSAAPPVTDGAALSRLTGAVVVAANYRLGPLGYLHLADLGGEDWADRTNLGLQDQAAALRWVCDNIAAFGGDADNVTVAGQSAGAFSIAALLAAPAAAGTFHRAILQSGNAGRIAKADTGTAIAADLLAALGLSKVDDLLQVPVEQILKAQNTVVDADMGRRSLPGGRAWGIVLDGRVLPRDPLKAIADGAASGIDLLIGTNRDEMRLFQILQGPALAPPDETALLSEMSRAGVAVPGRLLAAYRNREPDADLTGLRTMFLTDAVYRLPATRLAVAQTAAGGRTHTYLLAAQPMGPQMGACHGADLMMLFGRIDPTATELADTRGDLAAAWSRFIATGEPGWPTYDPEAAPNTRQFGGTDAMTTEPPPDAVTAAWTERP